MATMRVELSIRRWDGNGVAWDEYTVRRLDVATSVDAMEAGRRLGAELESPTLDYLIGAECVDRPADVDVFRGGYYEAMLPRCRAVTTALTPGDGR